MTGKHFLTITQQVSKHLLAEIQRGRWTERMPGKPYLAAELGVNHRTVEEALQQLERDGFLLAQGKGRCRRIAPQAAGASARPLRVGLFLWAPTERDWTYVVDIQHRLNEAGHVLVTLKETLLDLKMNVDRVARVVARNKVDAWVVQSGSPEVLAWFTRQKTPTFAMFGGWRGLSISALGPDKMSATSRCVRTLLEMGHRRIVMLIRRQHRLPRPVGVVEAFLNTLSAHGICEPGYSLPDWEETVEGFQKSLAALFQVTPPTAMLLDEPEHFVAAYHFLAARGLRVPEDVSLVYMGQESLFDWCVPTVARIWSDLSRTYRYILRWVDNLSRGRVAPRQIKLKAEYIPGGSVAPPRDAKPKGSLVSLFGHR